MVPLAPKYPQGHSNHAPVGTLLADAFPEIQAEVEFNQKALCYITTATGEFMSHAVCVHDSRFAFCPRHCYVQSNAHSVRRRPCEESSQAFVVAFGTESVTQINTDWVLFRLEKPIGCKPASLLLEPLSEKYHLTYYQPDLESVSDTTGELTGVPHHAAALVTSATIPTSRGLSGAAVWGLDAKRYWGIAGMHVQNPTGGHVAQSLCCRIPSFDKAWLTCVGVAVSVPRFDGFGLERPPAYRYANYDRGYTSPGDTSHHIIPKAMLKDLYLKHRHNYQFRRAMGRLGLNNSDRSRTNRERLLWVGANLFGGPLPGNRFDDDKSDSSFDRPPGSLSWSSEYSEVVDVLKSSFTDWNFLLGSSKLATAFVNRMAYFEFYYRFDYPLSYDPHDWVFCETKRAWGKKR